MGNYTIIKMPPKRERAKKGGAKFNNLSNDNPLWWRILLGIPKNLVYIFAGVILFAFLCMLYITYTEKDMTDFLSYDRTKEVIVVDPVFKALKSKMDLSKTKVDEIQASKFGPKVLNVSYMTKNKPVVVKGMAKSWGATTKWSDKQYFIDNVGQTTCMVWTINNFSPTGLDSDWSLYRNHPYQQPTTFSLAINRIKNNEETRKPFGDMAGDGEK